MDKKIILLVDDTPENIDLLKGLLKDNYKIKAATSGEKAIKIANKVPAPDLILLDVMMPVMDGYETCELLKSANETKDIPIIFVSGNQSDSEKEKGVALGAIDYISKPIQADYLFDKIHEIIGS